MGHRRVWIYVSSDPYTKLQNLPKIIKKLQKIFLKFPNKLKSIYTNKFIPPPLPLGSVGLRGG